MKRLISMILMALFLGTGLIYAADQPVVPTAALAVSTAPANVPAAASAKPAKKKIKKVKKEKKIEEKKETTPVK